MGKISLMDNTERSKDRSLSLVVPAYNEGSRIVHSLQRIGVHFADRSDLMEIIVVDDGSQDGTACIVQSLTEVDPRIRLLQNPINIGKGSAVRAGVLSAQGARIAFCDADLSAPIEELDQLLAHLDMGHDIAIGSRVHRSLEKRVERGLLRRVMANLFNLLVRGLLIYKIADTQCGLKAFKRSVALDLFTRQSITGFAFDVEILWMAQRSGYRIANVPISWVADAESRIRPWRDSLTMARDVVGLCFRERVIPACRGLGVKLAGRQPQALPKRER